MLATDIYKGRVLLFLSLGNNWLTQFCQSIDGISTLWVGLR